MPSDRYAHIDHPAISAILHELFRFHSEAEAAQQLAQMAEQFVISKKQPKAEKPSLLLWIKGYELNGSDKAVIGNYAIISCKEIDGRVALYATKQDVPGKEHPQRAQILRGTPNWGHPVMRAVRKKKVYESRGDVMANLASLHEDFPTVSTPTPDALYILVYCSERPANARMVKFKLTAEPCGEKSGFLIGCKEINRKVTVPLPHKQPRENPKGKFSAKVAASRGRRKKPTA